MSNNIFIKNFIPALSILFCVLFVACSGGGGGAGGGGDGNASTNSGDPVSSDLNIISPLQLYATDSIQSSPYGSLYSLSAMRAHRTQHSMVQMNNGNLFVYGGRYASGIFGNHSHSSSEIYDIQTNQWNIGPSASKSRTMPQMIALNNGRVLIDGSNQAEVFNPETNSISLITEERCKSSIARGNSFRSTLLVDGRVLLTGGNTLETEIYDSAAGSLGCFTVSASISATRQNHSATLLQDGRVLLVGGNNGSGADAEIYNPRNNEFAAIENRANQIRSSHTAISLHDGRVLLVGGTAGGFYLKSAEVFDPADNSFTQTRNDMNEARALPFLIPIASGVHAEKILVIGGLKENDPYLEGLETIEMFDTTTLSFSTIEKKFPSHHPYMAMAPLGNGKYAFTGGYAGMTDMIVYDTEHKAYTSLIPSGGSAPYELSILSGNAELNTQANLVLFPGESQDITIRLRDSSGASVDHTIREELVE